MHRAKHVATRRFGKVSLLIALMMVVGMMAAAPFAGADGAYVGTYENGGPYGSYFGDIDYVYNNSGYQFWFTVETSQYAYTAGHSYHIVYKYSDKFADSPDWCGPTTVRPNPAGTSGDAYYKIWDVTTETYTCGSP